MIPMFENYDNASNHQVGNNTRKTSDPSSHKKSVNFQIEEIEEVKDDG